MRIAILTLPLHTNYGGILQAYALQTYLQQRGHSTEILLLQLYNRPTYRIVLSLVKSVLLNVVGKGKDRFVLDELKTRLYQRKVLRNIEKFISKYINFSVSIKTVSQLNKLVMNHYDAILVGSDQVWRKDYIQFLPIEYYFLDFVPKHVKKIAFAASFGLNVSNFSDVEKENCGKAYSRLDYVSVREREAIDFIQNTLNWNNNSGCTAIMDPTFLFDKYFYIKNFKLQDVITRPNDIYIYILDFSIDKVQLLKHMPSKYRLIDGISSDSYFDVNHSVESLISPSSWIERIAQSSAIITDSFHCCVFAIIFRIPFLARLNNVRGNLRIESLLKTVGLSDRILYNDCVIDKEDLLTGFTIEELDRINKAYKRNISDVESFLDLALKTS